MAAGLARPEAPGQRIAHLPPGPLAGRGRGPRRAVQPVAARRGDRPWRRPRALRALHECAGEAAMSPASNNAEAKTFGLFRRKRDEAPLDTRVFDLLCLTAAVGLVLHA